MKKYFFMLLLLLPLLGAGQAKGYTAGLKIGTQMPDITISNILNYSLPSVKVSDFKGKLLILDFWATWCTACLNNLHKYVATSKEFEKEVFILPVTYESKELIKKFFSSKAGAGLNFPTACENTDLSELFPHHGIPHYVWIGPDGVVRAITNGNELTPDKIRAMLDHPEAQQWQVKKDVDFRNPLFLSDDYPKDNELLHYTIFSKGYYSGLPSGNHTKRKGNVIYGKSLTNSTLLAMYEMAARALFEQLKDTYDPKRLVINVRDSLAIMRVSQKPAKVLVLYNLDMVVPVDQADSLFQQLLTELNHYSHYYGKIEKREITCLALVRINEKDNHANSGDSAMGIDFSQSPASLTNCPVSALVNRMNALPYLRFPVIDETQLTGNINLVLANKIHSISGLKADLENNGLDLITVKRFINVFVIRDADGPNL